ncbi:NADPH-dependent FMN reductase [Candidatus Wolfebacteria bacterium]|nr:MAG: NADPH-dependent FMN reductase [Candidatus Wolfebacteria bacterium]
MKKLFIPIILGTAREGRKSEHVARFVHEYAQEYGFDTQIVDVKEFPFAGTMGSAELKEKWSAIAGKADGFVIVAPEYNFSFPGELKLLLDSIYTEYGNKPLGICGVSAGGLGASRMIEQLKLVAIALEMIPIKNSVHFSHVGEIIDESGAIKDVDAYKKKLGNFFEALAAHVSKK